MRKKYFIFGISFLLLLTIIFIPIFNSCTFDNVVQRKLFLPSEEKLKYKLQTGEDRYLKVHLHNGDLFLFNTWYFNNTADSLFGTGHKYDANRKNVGTGKYVILKNNVAIYEANYIDKSFKGAGLVVPAIATAAIGVYCLSDPKACFGSCPTFYVSDGKEMKLQSEAFSASVAPCMEDVDIDALYLAKPNSSNLEVHLTNEALETHIIRYANIVAVKKPKEGRAFVSPDNKYYQAVNIIKPNNCEASEGDIRHLVNSFDEEERFSVADSFDLAEKEIVELTFNNNSAIRKGIVVGFRQTLLTTYLYYQTLAYMGTKASDWLALLETSGETLKSKVKYPGELLGGMEFSVYADGEWEEFGTIMEVGPISTDVNIIPLPEFEYNDEIRIRIKMAKGLWRLNYLALGDIVKESEGIEIEPEIMFNRDNSRNDEALKQLKRKDETLITYRGDKFILYYELPDDFENYELFMKAKGYYLEWMRDEWLKEENQDKVTELLLSPGKYFREHAPLFKEREADMEAEFWGSRYVQP